MGIMMRLIRAFICMVLLTSTFMCVGQDREHLEDINKVWEKFYMAFDSLEYKYMANIHAKDLIRISGGKRISDYNKYIEGYKSTFENRKKDSIQSKISLRFFERINNEHVASERGIYKLISIKEGKEKRYYGEFHVILKKEEDEWKIWMDYDNNPDNSIGEEQYMTCYSIDNFEPFVGN